MLSHDDGAVYRPGEGRDRSLAFREIWRCCGRSQRGPVGNVRRDQQARASQFPGGPSRLARTRTIANKTKGRLGAERHRGFPAGTAHLASASRSAAHGDAAAGRRLPGKDLGSGRGALVSGQVQRGGTEGQRSVNDDHPATGGALSGSGTIAYEWELGLPVDRAVPRHAGLSRPGARLARAPRALRQGVFRSGPR